MKFFPLLFIYCFVVASACGEFDLDEYLNHDDLCGNPNGLILSHQMYNEKFGPSFCNFIKIHSKIYDSVDEAAKRLKIFSENYEIVKRMNAQDDGAEYSVEHSPFGDLTIEEFKEHILFPSSISSNSDSINRFYDPLFQKNEGNVKAKTGSFRVEDDDFRLRSNMRKMNIQKFREVGDESLKFDWVEQGKLTAIKSQGTLGTCWAFSAVTVVESQVAISQGKLTNYSVEQLVECANDENSTSGEADCAEFGGWPYLGFEYIGNFGGIYKDEDFPYCSGTIDQTTMLPECFPCMPKAYDKISCGDHSDLYCNISTTKGQLTDGKGLCTKVSDNHGLELAKIKSWEKLSSDEERLKTTLKEKGPISVALSAMILQFYFGGVISLPLCSSSVESLDHAVVLVGFGEGLSILGNPLPYWKVRNSWGVNWGEQGYFRLKRGVGMCGINLRPSIAYV